ncbi:MAG: metallophosphoesterase [Opitutales bacterium]|nr:metallophosphoesterase [Opitutales bacterium]
MFSDSENGAKNSAQPTKPADAAKAKRRKKAAFAILFAALLAFVIDAFIYEPHFALHTQETEIPAPHWTKELSNLKIALASDLHCGGSAASLRLLKKTVAEINAQKPDIVFLLGDFVNRNANISRQDLKDMADEIAKLRAPLGVYAVTGNHDEIVGAITVIEKLGGAGVKFLNNESVKISSPFGDFYAAGVRDISEGDFDFFSALKDVPKGAPLILLTHVPIYPALPPEASATFSGHMHGGQVRLPFIGALISPKILPFNSDNIGLLLTKRGNPIFITGGVGTSRITVRFLCSPVVDIVRLVPNNAAEN